MNMGLGAVWCGTYPMSDRVSQFFEMPYLPKNIHYDGMLFSQRGCQNRVVKPRIALKLCSLATSVRVFKYCESLQSCFYQ